MRCIGPLIPIPKYPSFAPDLKIELHAELTHDASVKYPKISFPILVILGDKDYYFSIESGNQMCYQIKDAKFVLLEKTGHESSKHKDFIRYIRNYLEI
jgi:pimeloyl-ACP methyl ester carboxylesterase